MSPVTRHARQGLKTRNNVISAGGLLSAVRTACFLLVLVSAGLTPDTARTQDTFASTLGGSADGGSTINTLNLGQGFTTGSAANGYNISSVVLRLGGVNPQTASSVRVTIRVNSGENPGSSVAELTRTPDLVGNSDNEFLAQGDIHLNPDTKYWILLEKTVGTPSFVVWNTTLDYSGVSGFGWDIESPPRAYSTDSNEWSDHSTQRFMVAINGTVAPGPALLSNLENTLYNRGVVSQTRLAQGFTTGPASGGYNIASVILPFPDVAMPDIPVSVTIRADNGGNPTGSTVATLTRSDDLVAGSENEFQVQGSARLNRNTLYWLLVELVNGPDTSATLSWETMRITDGAAPGSQFGWSFTRVGQQAAYGSDTFSTHSSDAQFKLGITGTEVPGGGPPGGPAVSDPRTRALEYNLASIGRALTATVVDHIRDRAERLEAGGDRTLAMVGGRVLDAGAFAEGADAQRVSRAIAGIFGGAPAEATELRALLPDARALREQTRLELTAGGASGAAGSTAFWARGDYTAFEGGGGDAFPGFASEGEVVSAHVGFDHRVNPETLVGVAVGQSEGETTHSFAAGGDRHDTETDLLSVHPYLHWKPAGGNRVWWGMVGWGTGDATLTEGTDRATTDIALRSWGIGVREVSRLDEFGIAVRADAFRTEIVADAVRSGAISVGETTGKATRVRAALEGSRDWELDGDAVLSGTAELGLRVDSGDGATGKGADIAGRLHYANPDNGLAATLQGSTLLTHDSDGFDAWGLGLLVVYDPGEADKGLQLTLNPSWNTPRYGVADALWDAGPGAVGNGTSADRGAALGLRVGYGMGALHDRALMTVYGEADGGRVRLGTELRPAGADRSGLEVYAERADREAGPEHLLGLALDLRF